MREQDDQNSPCGAAALSIGHLAEIACLLEVTARKPGNVHRHADFLDLHYLDFLLSATAIRDPLDAAPDRGLGATVLAAVQATREVVCTNTNLGMVLVLAPLSAVPRHEELARGVERVLAETTCEDARLVYQAIRLANPGGMGRVEEQDLADAPTLTLREVMSLAADRDLVARQYSNGFHEVLQEIVPMLRQNLHAGQPLETAIILTALGTLARHPDSLIIRKAGLAVAENMSSLAAAVLEAGWPENHLGEDRMLSLESALWTEDHQFNPGTTADLVTAALFATLRDGTIPLPITDTSTTWSGM